MRALAMTLAIGGVLVASGPVAARQTAAFRSTTNSVPVFVTVTTPDGAAARGLTRDDFVLLDDGRPQEIGTFSDEAQDISVSVVLDTSSSMSAALPLVFAAASTFLDRLLPGDRATVGSLLYLGPPFTADKPRLRTSLGMLPRDPASPIWTALDRSLAALANEPNRRVIVIYTDGRNKDFKAPKHVKKPTSSDILARVERGGVMTYAIGFEGVALTTEMKAIATRSGGRATELPRDGDLAGALTAIADELHHQYLLGFTPADMDGKTHQLEVRVKSPELMVRARQSYLAAK